VGSIVVTVPTVATPKRATYRYTNAFIWRADEWKAVSTHVSQVRPPPTAP
jgi:hypothetical protein